AAAVVSHGDVSDALASEQAELDRLRALQPDYDRLTFDVNLAAGEVSQVATHLTDMAALDRVTPPQGLVALRAQGQTAQARLDAARAALAQFQQTNSVNDLNAEISNHIAAVSELRRQAMLSATVPPGATDLVAPEQAELDRLYALVPEFERLSAVLSAAEANLEGLEAHKLQVVIASILPASAQVKVLDSARVQPDILFTIIVYTLGALLGVFGGLAVVYLMAYFDTTPYDRADVEALYPRAVLVLRVPRAF